MYDLTWTSLGIKSLWGANLGFYLTIYAKIQNLALKLPLNTSKANLEA